MPWEDGYSQGDAVEVLLANQWTAGTVAAAAPGSGVDVAIPNATVFYHAGSPGQIRHPGAAALRTFPGRVLLHSEDGGRWPATLVQSHPNDLAEVVLDHIGGRPLLVKTALLRDLE